MSARYRHMEAEHHHKSRYGRVKIAGAFLFFLVTFYGLVACATRLAMTGSIL